MRKQATNKTVRTLGLRLSGLVLLAMLGACGSDPATDTPELGAATGDSDISLSEVGGNPGSGEGSDGDLNC